MLGYILIGLTCVCLVFTYGVNDQLIIYADSISKLSNSSNLIDGLDLNTDEIFADVSSEDVKGIFIWWGYALLILLLLIFIVTGLGWGRGYLTSKPGDEPPKKPATTSAAATAPKTPSESERREVEVKKLQRRLASLDSEKKSWAREQDLSTILAGFTLSALVFILAIGDVRVLESPQLENQQTIEFFSIAFILEVLSFLSFRIKTRRAFDYFGTLSQFTGSLALINGFIVFVMDKTIIEKAPIPWIIVFVFIIGYIGFFVFVLLNLIGYIEFMRKFL